MTPQLRERILRSLRWLVRDATYRFDDQKSNLERGSKGGYSPELTEAQELLSELDDDAGEASPSVGPGDLMLCLTCSAEFYYAECKDGKCPYCDSAEMECRDDLEDDGPS